ncbi:unnamed protein product [Blepharisma stoltei]|uniref:Mitochondrial pyruvate carrier n=1 Tax=Blepharisma stoltei TaxID=1481888 RepID=A0AAU9K2R4_9CILI|nr:unnamed protein product [Blepharisma stoltei]
MEVARKFWNHPMGPKTTHFWGPVFNWGFIIAGLLDMEKPPEKISRNMTIALVIYSTMFSRFAWMVNPRNYLLMTCHITNVTVQLNLLRRKYNYTPKASS